jgi:mRNA interferase HigB
MSFNVVSKSRLVAFGQRHSTAASPLARWHAVAQHARWSCAADVKQTFNSVDWVGGLAVFDVGSGFRIVADVFFLGRRIYIKHVFTHAEYDKWTKEQRGK